MSTISSVSSSPVMSGQLDKRPVSHEGVLQPSRISNSDLQARLVRHENNAPPGRVEASRGS